MKAALKELRNYRGIAFRWFLALVLVSPATPLRSDEQTAVTSTRDATINQAAPATNDGAATTVSTHTALTANQRSLVRFDLGATGLDQKRRRLQRRAVEQHDRGASCQGDGGHGERVRSAAEPAVDERSRKRSVYVVLNDRKLRWTVGAIVGVKSW